MAKLLYIWELGGGLGHLSPMLPIVKRVVSEGHQVHLVLRSMEKTHLVFGDLPVTYWQAPLQTTQANPPHHPPSSLTHVLANTCFRDENEFPVRVKAWHSLIRSIQPDLVLLDHAPSALLALELFSIPRVVLGVGFMVPPRCDPFPSWRPELKLTEQQLKHDDEMLLQQLNRWRLQNGLPCDALLADLYAKAQHQLLMTFPELDPFGPRPTTYQGVWPGLTGKPPQWKGSGNSSHGRKKVFVYLKPHARIEPFLQHLRACDAEVLLFIPAIKSGIAQAFEGPMTFSREPVDLSQAAQECDLAVLNATHLSVSTFLLAGKPILLLPIFLEQRLTAERVAAIGAGASFAADQMHQCGGALRFLLADDRPRSAAQRFQQRYHQFDFAKRAEQVALHILGLLS